MSTPEEAAALTELARFRTQIEEIDRKVQEAEASAEQRAADLRQLDRELDRQGGKVQLLDMQLLI